MPAIKIENIIWSVNTEVNEEEYATFPLEVIVDIHESHYLQEPVESIIHNVLESYTNIPAKSFDFSVVMRNGPVLRYFKNRENTLAFSGPLW